MIKKAIDANTVIDSLTLAIVYEKTKEERMRGSHLSKWMIKGATGATGITAHPSRVRWAVDKEAFEALLRDLHDLIERIHNLIGSYRPNEIHDITVKTYRELVVVHNDVEGLESMADAVTRLIENPQQRE